MAKNKTYTSIIKALFLSCVLLPINLAFADVLVSGFTSFTFSSFTGRGDVTGNVTLCVCSDSNAYNVTVFGTGPGNSFSLTRNSHNINYTAYWNDSASSSGKTQLTPNVAKNNMTTSYGCNRYDCNGTKNAYLEIFFSEADLLAAIHGSYTGSITVIVEPN